jgi:DNA-binding transcriptional LysR family regulator
VDLGSFSMAAEDMGLSQPAVTFQIQALEKELGTTLLDRSPRRVLPTESGRILYDHARPILRHADRARREIDDLNQLLRGTLLVGASTGPGEHILPQVLGRFKAEYPDVDVVLRILPTNEIIEQVLAYDLEIGVVGAKDTNPKLLFEPLIQDRLTVILQESIKTAVEAGFGVGLISRFAVRQELRFGTLAEVQVADLPSFRDEFYLVRSRRRELSRLTQVFLSFAREQVSSLAQ